ncbi:ArnT family glycosyltransferase [Mucilaginibacter arboris]|uniref:Glycosyl transferase n=1 Tax=Mucilaginibacter arboris TaxID=2682090 RepID=A0A7K1T042_9SPHI|nr:glycosyltransferase family 39 protein [Mucilaginibacter arboris]MVN22935.1 glycosyl transferase [Mucilaginibacter arboris]
MSINLKKDFPFLLVLLLAVAVNFSGIQVPFFTDDPGLYAALAKNMVLRGSYWELFSYGKDWLDKPHFPFWMAALSFKLFGIATWTYKLPALLFFVLSGVYTYLFAKKNYGQKTALMAVLVLFSAQHILMSNTDVRAEPYLMALIIGSVYHFYQLEKRFSWTDLFIGSLFAGCAVMTKGIFALIPIGASVIGELVFKKRYAEMLRLKWLLAVVLTAVFILPEIYSLYLQFDSQPGKATFQDTPISGIRWFLWDSQFGRFINSGPITRKSGSIFFYVHTLIWAFAPWFFMLAYAVFINLKKMFQKQQLPEYYTFCGALSMWLIFSLSGFQLPFYTNIIFPFFAIITASVFSKMLSLKTAKVFKVLQIVQVCVLFLAVLVFQYFLHPGKIILFSAEVIGFVLISFYCYKRSIGFGRVLLLSCCATLFVNFYLNTIFYPLLATYKADTQAPVYINQHFPNQPVYVIRSLSNPFQFYCKVPVQLLAENDLAKDESTKKIIYTDEATVKKLQQKHPVEILKVIDNYPNENILKDFIWYKKRRETLDRYYIIRY